MPVENINKVALSRFTESLLDPLTSLICQPFAGCKQCLSTCLSFFNCVVQGSHLSPIGGTGPTHKHVHSHSQALVPRERPIEAFAD